MEHIDLAKRIGTTIIRTSLLSGTHEQRFWK